MVQLPPSDEQSIVDLTPLDDPALVLPAIAVALDVRAIAGEPAPIALQRALRGSHRLLVLDNLEHVLAAASEIAALLEACARLVILGTSCGQRSHPASASRLTSTSLIA